MRYFLREAARSKHGDGYVSVLKKKIYAMSKFDLLIFMSEMCNERVNRICFSFGCFAERLDYVFPPLILKFHY